MMVAQSAGVRLPEPSPRLAIITGTSSGIGETLARQLLGRGWRVVGISRRSGSLITPQYTHVRLDLTDVTGLAAALDAKLGPMVRDTAVTRLGLVNNAAAVALLGTMDQVDPAAMLQAYAINTVAPVQLMGWVLRTARPTVPVRIVNVSSGAAVEAFPGLGAYGATKAALRLAGMVLAAELDGREASGAAHRDVTIWSYEPGVVATPMQEAVRSSTSDTVPIVQMFRELEAAGRLLPPEVPAAAIATYLEADGHPRFGEQRFLLS